MKTSVKLAVSPRQRWLLAQSLGPPENDKGCLSLGCSRVLCLSWARPWQSWGHGWCGTRGQASWLSSAQGDSALMPSALMPSALSVSTATRGPSCWR